MGGKKNPHRPYGMAWKKDATNPECCKKLFPIPPTNPILSKRLTIAGNIPARDSDKGNARHLEK